MGVGMYIAGVYGTMNCLGNITAIPILLLALASLVLLTASCSTEHRAFSRTLPDGQYRIKENAQWKKVVVYNDEDTTHLVFDTAAPHVHLADYLYTHAEQMFVRHSLDLDVFSTPVKLRFAQKEVPRQLNAQINGNFYMGYRTDRYLYGKREPVRGKVQRYRHRVGYGGGAFLGLGSVFINPTFLQDAIPYEYDGVVLSYGAAVLVGYGNINTGLCLGFDFLTDRYRSHWIYQNKPWLGVTIGINLN